VDPDIDPNAEERGRFGKIFKSDETLRAEVKTWANGVQLKVSQYLSHFHQTIETIKTYLLIIIS
jgi:hypothetical protein